MSVVEVVRGESPVVLAFPHTGTDLPPGVGPHLNDTGLALADTDWWIHDLYAGLLPSATTVRTSVHRYVIDVNRDPMGASLYPGQNTTTLCPTTDFDGRPIHISPPDEAEIARRVDEFHAPYHVALAEEIGRAKARHGFAVVYDCHSIRSQIPNLFGGTLTDFNVGTFGGLTCDPRIEAAVVEICRKSEGYSSVLNGRFKGGWTTRNYGQPDNRIHAIQMELAQSTYMEESPPWRWSPERVARLRPVLKEILTTIDALARSGALTEAI